MYVGVYEARHNGAIGEVHHLGVRGMARFLGDLGDLPVLYQFSSEPERPSLTPSKTLPHTNTTGLLCVTASPYHMVNYPTAAPRPFFSSDMG